MTNNLPIRAKVMIGSVAVASLCPLALGVMNGQMSPLPQLGLLMAAAVMTSRLKVKLPGMASTMSGNLPVVLLGVTQLGLLGSLLVAATAALAQSYGPGKIAKPAQFIFNVCTLMNACGLAYLVYHSGLLTAHAGGSAISLAMAAAAYFVANTAPVASIIGFTEGSSPFTLWHKVFLWSFPNYVIGAGLTAIVSFFTTIGGMATLMVVLFAVHKSYRMYVGRTEQKEQAVQPKALAMAAGR